MHRLKLRSRVPLLQRSLHSKPFGYRPPSTFTLPDFTSSELSNRVKNASLLRLVESYRKHAHRAARVDPLGLADRSNVPALDPRRYGFQLDEAKVREDFVSEVLPEGKGEGEKKFDVTGILDFPDGGKLKTIGEISQRLEEVYTGGVGYEVSRTVNSDAGTRIYSFTLPQFMHLPSKHERRFLEKMLEQSHAVPIPTSQQLAHWKLLAASEGFDAWCAKRFPNVKRYGLQGGEGMMVALSALFEEAGKEGVDDVVM